MGATVRSYSPVPLVTIMPNSRVRLGLLCTFLTGIVTGFILSAWLGHLAIDGMTIHPKAPAAMQGTPGPALSGIPLSNTDSVGEVVPHPQLVDVMRTPTSLRFPRPPQQTSPPEPALLQAPYRCHELPPLPETPLYSAKEAASFLAKPPFPYDQLKCLAPQLDRNGNLVDFRPGFGSADRRNYRRSDAAVEWMQKVIDRVGTCTCAGGRVLVQSKDAQSYSQQFEDMSIYASMCNSDPTSVCNGNKVVVELGAVDGRDMSNSFFFERQLGWRSLLIEANPDNFAKLHSNRPGPKAIKVNNVICQPGESRSFAKAKAAGSGGIVQSLDPRKVAKYGVDTQNSVDIPCTDFKTLYRQNNITAVEFFSLDVEGAEELVLQHMDWSVPIRFLLVEMDGGLMYTAPANKAFRCRELLGAHGYFPAVWGRMGENVLFVRTRADALPNFATV